MKSAMPKVLLLAFCMAGVVRAVEPEVESIDYAHPDAYRDFPDSLGDRAAILAQAQRLKGDSDANTIGNVLGWLEQNLKYDGKQPYRWRNYDDMLREKIYGGCADYGIACGVLLKGAGIPAVWVKTMDVAWIWDFKKGRPFQSWSGHVFLEVFVNGKWTLLDPGGKTLYNDYSPKMRILPGRRFAYHKGNDPKTMIMSSQWEPWKQQTDAYFRKLDETLLPVDEKNTTSIAAAKTTSPGEKGGASRVRQAYVVGNSPYYQALTAMATESGLRVARSFNCKYDEWLPQAKGHVLVIETHKGQPIVGKDILEKYYPKAFAGLSSRSKTIRVNNTTIVFVEFSEQLQAVGKKK